MKYVCVSTSHMYGISHICENGVEFSSEFEVSVTPGCRLHLSPRVIGSCLAGVILINLIGGLGERAYLPIDFCNVYKFYAPLLMYISTIFLGPTKK